MRLPLSRLFATVTYAAAAVSVACAAHSQAARPPGEVVVLGNRLIRDGQPWVPHGFYQIAFEAAPAVLGSEKPFWGIASRNYSPDEYAAMRRAGADSVRIQVSQPGMDPDDRLFTRKFLQDVTGAVRAARETGLTVIISVQDETQSGEGTPADLPNDSTRRVWKELAPVFGHDRGVLFELFNEPRLRPSPQNWRDWAMAMDETIRTVRGSGAVNVVVADGLQFAERLAGAPPLHDPLRQVAYASHPYAHDAMDQTPRAWDAKFGNFSRSAPVIVTEWSTAYFCDADTARSAVSFIDYLRRHHIGLEAGTWDWAPAHFGSAVYAFPQSSFSSFASSSSLLRCADAGFGPGEAIEGWYLSGMAGAW